MTPARRSLIVLAAVATAITVVVLAVAGGREPQRSDIPSPPSSAATAPAPDRPNLTPTTGSTEPSTETGARRAAVRFLELTEQVVAMTPGEGADAQRAISTGRSAERLATDVQSKLAAIHAQVPEGVTVHVAPVAVRSTRPGDGWSVAVWYVEVAVYGRELAVEQWTTATYSMVWEADGWRMDDLVSTPGPYPTRPATATATPVGQLLAALNGFTDEGATP